MTAMTAGVYVMESCGALKIGISLDAHHRRINLQIGNPHPIALLAFMDFEDQGYEAREVEAELHRRLASKRIRGEWFAVTIDEIEAELKDMPSREGMTAGETAPKFDKVAYQREYMRKRREAARKAKEGLAG